MAVDLRRSSPTFGKWLGELHGAEYKRQLWVPEGFAHRFLVLLESADFFYKAIDYYAPQYKRCSAWSDGRLAIAWLIVEVPLISFKDANASSFAETEVLIG